MLLSKIRAKCGINRALGGSVVKRAGAMTPKYMKAARLARAFGGKVGGADAVKRLDRPGRKAGGKVQEENRRDNTRMDPAKGNRADEDQREAREYQSQGDLARVKRGMTRVDGTYRSRGGRTNPTSGDPSSTNLQVMKTHGMHEEPMNEIKSRAAGGRLKENAESQSAQLQDPHESHIHDRHERAHGGRAFSQSAQLQTPKESHIKERMGHWGGGRAKKHEEEEEEEREGHARGGEVHHHDHHDKHHHKHKEHHRHGHDHDHDHDHKHGHDHEHGHKHGEKHYHKHLHLRKGGRAHKERGGFLAGMKKGALHKEMGIPEGHKIPAGKLEKAAHSDNPTLKRRAVLAQTMKKWHHGG